MLIQVVGNVAMIIDGSYQRWEHSGTVCSGQFITTDTDRLNGPYLLQAGSFMKMYLIFMWIVFSLVCCVCCGAVGVGVWWSRKE